MSAFSRRLLLGSLLFGAFAGKAFAQQTDFAIGQEWTVRDIPEGHAIIGLIDEIDGTRIIHAFVLRNGMPEFGELSEAGISYEHLAFSQEAFAASVIERVESDGYIPDGFRTEYERWRSEPFVINVPIAEFVRLTKTTELRSTT